MFCQNWQVSGDDFVQFDDCAYRVVTKASLWRRNSLDTLHQQNKTGGIKPPVLFWRRQRDSNPRGVAPKRFSRSLPKNTVSAQFGAVCAKTIRENPYFTRLFGTVWNCYELKRIDRNRYRPLVFWVIFCTLERIWREFAREELQLQYIETFLFLERIFHDLGENFLCVTI